MNPSSKNSRSLIDLVFEGRNKNYGAYELRVGYDRTLCRAIAWVVLLTASFFMSFYFTRKVISSTVSISGQLDPLDYYTIPVDITPAEKFEQAPPAKKPAASASSADARVISNDAVPVDQPAMTVSTNSSGVPEGPANVESPVSTGMSSPPLLKPDSVFESYNIDTYPEFEGGLGALRRFVATHLRYPAEEAESGQEGIVLVRFIVDENGAVSKVSTQISATPAFDKEAMRVVSLLPPFKSPGKAGGRAVKVAFTLPVKFRSQ